GYAEVDGDRVLRVGETPAGEGRVLASTRAFSDRLGAPAMMSWFEPSPSARYVAVSVGAGGDMLGRWFVVETATGRAVTDVPGISYSGARPAWLPDESGFWIDGVTEEGLHRLRFVPVAEGAAERPDVVFPASLVGGKHSGLTAQVAPNGR